MFITAAGAIDGSGIVGTKVLSTRIWLARALDTGAWHVQKLAPKLAAQAGHTLACSTSGSLIDINKKTV